MKGQCHWTKFFKKFILSTSCIILKTLCVGHTVVRLHVRFGMVNQHPTLFFFGQLELVSQSQKTLLCSSSHPLKIQI